MTVEKNGAAAPVAVMTAADYQRALTLLASLGGDEDRHRYLKALADQTTRLEQRRAEFEETSEREQLRLQDWSDQLDRKAAAIKAAETALRHAAQAIKGYAS